MKVNYLKICTLSLFLFFIFPLTSFAYTIGENTSFNVDKDFANGKEIITGTLLSSPDRIYFYIEDGYWNRKNEEERKKIESVLNDLAFEFNTKIYSGITSVFGTEAFYGIDREARITILFHETKKGVNGYVRNVDVFEKTVNPYSNQRKMIYLSTDVLSGKWAKEVLAHEFVHLITFNKKELRYGISEDVWLNEARAEYAITLLGYNEGNDTYINSRIDSFLEKPYSSLTEWGDSVYDYGVINSFVHYLVDQYGINILVDSLNSGKKGVESIEDALLRNGSRKSFSQVFTNWTIATYINDCSAGAKYCFKDENFENLYIIPFSNFMPFTGENTLYTGQTLKNFSAHWQRYVGGAGELNIKFSNPSGVPMTVPYIIKGVDGKNTVKFMALDENQEAEVSISGIGKDIGYVTFIPSIGDKNINSNQNSYFYSITSKTFTKINQEPQEQEIKLPFTLDKPLNQMNREELLMVIIRTIIYLLLQGKLVI